jgi:outer membrane lipoprotein carrier protein
MRTISTLIFLTALGISATPLDVLLKKIEARYNGTKTLRSEFQQTVAVSQGRRVSESGVLFLRKPGQMRWEYAQPAGKLFLSDGKQLYYVTPAARRVEQSEMKVSDDLRAPLAFLLGRLDFQKDFQRFETSPAGNQTKIRATPRSEKTMFEYIEFLADSEGKLSVVSVTGKDGSVMTYSFANEQRNLPLAADMFRFAPPPGYEVVTVRGEP